MSRLGNIGLALENEEDMLTGAEESTVTPEDIQDLATVEEQVADVTADTEAMASAEADIEVVEEIQEVLEEAAASGEGVSETAAQIATIVVESLRDKLGLAGFTRPMPSLESFGTTSSRVTATNLAVEAIGDTVSRAWEAVKAFFKKIWEKIKGFYKSIFDGATRLENRVRKTQKLISEKSRYDATETSFENKTIATAFTYHSETAVKSKTVTEMLENANAALTTVGTVAKNVSKYVENKDMDRSKFATSVFSMAGFMGSLIEPEAEGNSVFTTDEMIGGTTIFVEFDGPKAKGLDLKDKSASKKDSVKVARSGVAKVHVKAAGKREIDDSVPVLAIAEMTKVCTECLSSAKLLADFKKVESEIDKVVKAINKTADEQKKKGTDEGRDEAEFSMQAGKILNTVSIHAPAQAMRTAVSAMNYVDASLRFYKKD